MLNETLNLRIKNKTDTLTNWQSNFDFVPYRGEIITILDNNDETVKSIVIGDGKSSIEELFSRSIDTEHISSEYIKALFKNQKT